VRPDPPKSQQSATLPREAKFPPGPAEKVDSKGGQRDPLRFLLDLASRYGDLIRYETAYGKATYLTNDPEQIGQVLGSANYARGPLLPMVLGNGLLASDGEYWRRQRRMVQPDFHHQRIIGFAPLITGATIEMLERWQRRLPTGEPIDVAAEMARLTLDIIIRALFSGDLKEAADTLREAITRLLVNLGGIMCAQFNSPLTISPSRNAQFRESLQTIDRIVYGAILDRRRYGRNDSDFLSLLLSARDEDGKFLEDRQVRDEVVTFLTAGSETTSTMLGWTWYLLALHADVERDLHAEVDAVLAGRTVTIRDLANLGYTRMVIEESMRLYPPIWSLIRQVKADDILDGYRVTAGASFVVSPYTMHRHPRYWPDPERFDPQRFAPGAAETRPRNAYLPFGAGRHTCLGNHFAMMEGQLIIATIAQRYRLRLVPGHPVEPDPLLSLRHRYGVMTTLESR
jgi:cytochrome P450